MTENQPDPFSPPTTLEPRTTDGSSPRVSLSISTGIALIQQPRETIRRILNAEPDWTWVVLAAVFGIERSLRRILRNGIPPEAGLSRWEVLGISIVSGILSGIVIMVSFSYVLAWAARILGGRPKPRDLRLVLAWSYAPIIPAVIVLILLFLFGPEQFVIREPGTTLRNLGNDVIAPLVLYTIVLLFAFVTLIRTFIIGISEACQFTVTASIVTFILGAGAAVAFLTGLVYVYVEIYRRYNFGG